MRCHLIIQPLDCQYEFLEDIGRNAKRVYESRIRSFDVSPSKALPEHLFLKPRSFLGKFFMKERKMIYLHDLCEELRTYWTYNSEKIMLTILPHFILGFGHDLVGLNLQSNLSIVSTYSINRRYMPQACVGISLHEIGHNLGLSHCRNDGCLMKTPCKPENFYKGIFDLCDKHTTKF